MVEIDARSASVTKRIKLEGCEGPSGLAMDTKARRIFSVCANKVMVVSDPDAAKAVATLPIGQGADGAGFDPGRGHAFSSNGDGTLTVVNGSGGKYEVIQNVQTQRGARTLALDIRTHKIYLPAAQYGPGPAPTPQNPRPRPSMIPDSFALLVVEE
jgi:DNA-binding beta-propeller fold protein YncE